MCDSPSLSRSQNQSHSLSECSHSGTVDWISETSVDKLNLLRDDGSLLNVRDSDYETGSPGLSTGRNSACPYRFQLELDVQKLQEQLREEIELHAVLEQAIERSAVKLSKPSCLPHQAQELLSNITMLELAVSKLEHEIVSLHFQLSQERNERRLAEYRLRHASLEEKSLCSSGILQELDEDGPSAPLCDNICAGSAIRRGQTQDSRKLPRELPPKGLWDYPNLLSEEMVRCMKNIYISLADSASPCQFSTSQGHLSPLSPYGHLSNSSWWSSSERSVISSWVQSPQIDVQSNLDVLASDNACDPYRVRGKLSWGDVGNYGLASEVSWMSVGKKQLEYASGALRKFRTLVEQLAKVNPIHLSSNDKLAFWINLYNAMIMHAYLAYGVPKSDMKLFSLMQKAAYTVGGHSLSAAVIEYGILKMKPPLHRPQIALLLALHKLKVSEEQRKFAVDVSEPLVAFALSCGMYSSPAVRTYTAKNVGDELQEAQRDFIRASVGVSSKGRLLVPKMLHCFAKGFVDDASLAVWISHYLPPHQAAFVERCTSQRRQSLLGSRNCGILPFDSRFRYLFLPEKIHFDSACP